MAGKKAGERINLAVRTNIVRAVNVGSPGSTRAASSSQSVHIRQHGGETQVDEVHEIGDKKEAAS